MGGKEIEQPQTPVEVVEKTTSQEWSDKFILERRRIAGMILEPGAQKKVEEITSAINALAFTIMDAKDDPNIDLKDDEKASRLEQINMLREMIVGFSKAAPAQETPAAVPSPEAEEEAEPKNEEKEQAYQDWSEQFQVDITKLSEIFNDESLVTNELVAQARVELQRLRESFLNALEEFDNVDLNNRQQPTMLRFADIERKIESQEQLYYIYELSELTENYRESMDEDDFDFDATIANLNSALSKAESSLEEGFKPVEVEKYKAGVLDQAKKLIEQLNTKKQAEITQELADWKTAEDADFSTKVAAFKTRLTGLTTTVEADTLAGEIKTYIEDLKSKSKDKNEEIKKDAAAKIGSLNQILEEVKKITEQLAEKESKEELEASVSEYKTKLKPLTDIIDRIFENGSSIPFGNLINAERTALTNAYTQAIADGLGDRANSQNDRVEQLRQRIFGGDANGGRYSDALKILDERQKELDNILKPGGDFDTNMAVLDNNYLQSVNGSSLPNIVEASNNIREMFADQPDSKVAEVINLFFRMRDVTNQSDKETQNTLMWTRDSAEFRLNTKKFINTPELRKFRYMGEVKFINPSDGTEITFNVTDYIEQMEEYFQNPVAYEPYVDKSGKHQPAGKWSYTDGLGDVDWYKTMKNGIPYDAEGNVIPENQRVYRDSSANPKKFLLRLNDQIVEDNPQLKNLPGFVAESLFHFCIVAEMRKNYMIPDYARYKASPIPNTQDFGDLPTISPFAAHLYGVQSSSIINMDLYPYLFRFPEPDMTSGSRQLPAGYDARLWTTALDKTAHPHDWKGDSLKLPRKAVGREIQMRDTIDVVLPSKLKNEANVQRSIQLIEIMRTIISPVEIGQIDVPPDFKVLPSYYDIIRGNFHGHDLIDEDGPTMEVYNELISQINDFYHFVNEGFRPISRVEDLDTHIGMMIANIKKFKGIWGIINPTEDNGFTQVVQLLMIVFIKKLYNNYKNLVQAEMKEQGKLTYFGPKHVRERAQATIARFIDVVEPLLVNSKTLPQFLVRNEPDSSGTPKYPPSDYYVVDSVFDEITSKPELRGFRGKFTKWGVFFDNSFRTTSLEDTLMHLLNSRMHHLHHDLELYTRDPKLADKGPEK